MGGDMIERNAPNIKHFFDDSQKSYLYRELIRSNAHQITNGKQRDGGTKGCYMNYTKSKNAPKQNPRPTGCGKTTKTSPDKLCHCQSKFSKKV